MADPTELMETSFANPCIGIVYVAICGEGYSAVIAMRYCVQLISTGTFVARWIFSISLCSKNGMCVVLHATNIFSRFEAILFISGFKSTYETMIFYPSNIRMTIDVAKLPKGKADRVREGSEELPPVQSMLKFSQQERSRSM